MRLEAFSGCWQIERSILDRLGEGARFEGECRFYPHQSGLRYEETGWLYPGRNARLAARRCYDWHEDLGQIVVSFEDGKLFHAFDCGEAQPSASHDCPPDFYRVQYDFSCWPDWRADWRVTGPRKDYEMKSIFRPAGQNKAIGARQVRTEFISDYRRPE